MRAAAFLVPQNKTEMENTTVSKEAQLSATGKRIEVVQLRSRDLKTGFGNPRKITKKKLDELAESLDMFGDFGIFLIDEHDNLIAGNQRHTILMANNPDTQVTCKRLIGYTEAELRAINIKDNTHSGDWDLDLLADWTADLTVDLGLNLDDLDIEEREIKDMELIHYEKYNYVLIACRYETDYNDLIRKLNIEGRKIAMTKTRSIKARAIWYDEMPCDLVPKSGDGK